jgi:hypothetical protein
MSGLFEKESRLEEKKFKNNNNNNKKQTES